MAKRTALMLRSAMAGWAKGKSGMGHLRVDASLITASPKRSQPKLIHKPPGGLLPPNANSEIIAPPLPSRAAIRSSFPRNAGTSVDADRESPESFTVPHSVYPTRSLAVRLAHVATVRPCSVVVRQFVEAAVATDHNDVVVGDGAEGLVLHVRSRACSQQRTLFSAAHVENKEAVSGQSQAPR